MASVDEKQGHGRVLEFDKVTKSFAKTDSNEITHALAEVNLTIQPGEFVSIVGTSGCGKSTILRLIAGLIRPTTGEIRLGGKPIVGAGSWNGIPESNIVSVAYGREECILQLAYAEKAG